MKTLKTIVIALLVAGFMPFGASAQTYTVGLNEDLGGYVIYVTPDGKHGVVSATKDQGYNTWGEAHNLINHPQFHNNVGKNFTDWRLPTRYELNVMYARKDEIGGFVTSNNIPSYWTCVPDKYYSSMGSVTLQVNIKRFNTGEVDKNASDSKRRIRAVRSF